MGLRNVHIGSGLAILWKEAQDFHVFHTCWDIWSRHCNSRNEQWEHSSLYVQ